MNNLRKKICSLCKEEKTTDQFGRNKTQKYNLHYYCQACTKNIREAQKERDPDYFKNYREKNKQKLNDYQKEYRRKSFTSKDPEQQKDIEELSQKKRAKEKERRKDPDRQNKRRHYFKNKYKTDEQYRLKKLFEAKLNRLLTNNDETDKSKDLIGCTIPEFKAYLETKFLRDMGWDNYGTEWNLDRVTPFCDFNLLLEEEAKKCFHYTNAQPLFIQTRIVDGVEYIGNANKNRY